MPYVKVGPWVNGAPPALEAANLDQVETQYDEAAADLVTHGALSTGTHGAGGDTLATDADIATHALLTATHGVGEIADEADLRHVMKPPLVRWVAPGWAWSGHQSQVVTASRIYYMPIYVDNDTTYDRIGIYVNVGDSSGGVADLRIFEWSAGIPGDLILSAGTVSTNGAGAKEITIAESLTQGYYFLAVRCDDIPQLAGIGQGRTLVSPVGGVATINDQAGPSGVVLYDDAAYTNPAGAVDGVKTEAFVFARLREA